MESSKQKLVELHTEHPTKISRPKCPQCGAANLICHVGGTVYCRSCGYDSRKE